MGSKIFAPIKYRKLKQKFRVGYLSIIDLPIALNDYKCGNTTQMPCENKNKAHLTTCV